MNLPAMAPQTKDWIQVISWIVGVIGGLIAASIAIFQFGANRKQREEELRWQKANIAKQIVEDIHRNEYACQAVTMLDWSEGAHEYEVDEGQTELVSYTNDVLPVLRKPVASCLTDKERFIVDSFDWFCYLIDRIEHYIVTGLIEFDDVRDIFKPYARKIKDEWATYENFMNCREYELASRFWKRQFNHRGRRLRRRAAGG